MRYQVCLWACCLQAAWSADYPMNAHRKLEIPISSSSMTRIYVEGDRIHQVFGLEGRYFLETEEEMGQIFIKPLEEGSETPFAITVLTEEGVSQDVLLKPQKGHSGEPICLKQNKKLKSLASGALSQKASSYEQEILQKIKLSLSASPQDHFEALEDTPVPEISLTGLKTEWVRSLGDASYVISIFELTNTQPHALSLELEELARPHDIALALDKAKIPPHEKATLVRVRLRRDL